MQREHGCFDFLIILCTTMNESASQAKRRIYLRKSPFVLLRMSFAVCMARAIRAFKTMIYCVKC